MLLHSVQERRRLEIRWHRCAREFQQCRAHRSLAAFHFVDRSQLDAPYIETHRLFVWVMYTDNIWSRRASHHGDGTMRLCGYRVSRDLHGVHWGGIPNSEVFKDVGLMPSRGARGERIDSRKIDIFCRALELHDQMILADLRPDTVRCQLRLPKLWAAFRAEPARHLHGEGPEFEMACRQSCLSGEELLHASCISFEGLKLFPLDWFSSELQAATTIFAEMEGFEMRQVVRLQTPSKDLCGYAGASSFDFYHNRYRPMRPKTPHLR
jgi:hypothetical protein